MAKKAETPLVRISSWAVGRFADRPRVAIRLNEVVMEMSVADAKAIAAALHSEAQELGRVKQPRLVSRAAS